MIQPNVILTNERAAMRNAALWLVVKPELLPWRLGFPSSGLKKEVTQLLLEATYLVMVPRNVLHMPAERNEDVWVCVTGMRAE